VVNLPERDSKPLGVGCTANARFHIRGNDSKAIPHEVKNIFLPTEDAALVLTFVSTFVALLNATFVQNVLVCRRFVHFLNSMKKRPASAASYRDFQNSGR
jgi:hypothetical protein